MNKFKYLALAFLLCVGGAAFAQGIPGYVYPVMPQIHQAGGGGAAAATATASPSPAFVAATAISTAQAAPSPAIPASVHAGDCVVMVTANNAGSSTAPNFAMISGWGEITTPDSSWTTNGVAYNFEKLITPSEITTGSLALTGLAANVPICMAYFRHVTCSNDSKASNHATSTAPRPNSITTTINGDKIVSLGLVNGSTGLTYTTPAGYTNAVYFAPITGTSWGCYIDYITTAQATAGATQPAAGTISVSNDWYATQWALPNLGGTP